MKLTRFSELPSFQAVETGEHLKEICLKTEKLMEVFSEDEMNSMFEPTSHLGVSGEIVDEAIALARECDRRVN